MKHDEARKLIGQRMVVGFSGTDIDHDLLDLIQNYKIGNIILFKHNITSISQLKQLCQDIKILVKKHTGYNPFITIDQEGGMVTRLGEDGVNMPGAMAIAATDCIENSYIAGKITGQQLKEVGVNFNLAPTVDVNSNPDNPVIGVRSFSDMPDEAAKYSEAMVKGLMDGGVLASAKHFPGHGDTHVDSHLGLPRIEKTLEELEVCELIPFRQVIQAGIPSIMTTHILFPKLEPESIPATMSHRIITGLLREKIGFKGLIVSDCLEMNAIKKYYGTVKGAKMAIEAGVDLIFISHTAKVAREVSDYLTKSLEQEKISLSETLESVERIKEYKKAVENFSLINNDFNLKNGKKVAKQILFDSITPVQMPTSILPDIGKNPLFIGPSLFRATNVSNKEEKEINFPKYLAERFGGTGIISLPDPNDEQIQSFINNVEKYTSVIIGTYNGHLYPGQVNLINQLAKKHQRVIVIALRNPYDLRNLPKNIYGIAAYEYTKKSLKAIAKMLEHQFTPKGKLPVKL